MLIDERDGVRCCLLHQRVRGRHGDLRDGAWRQVLRRNVDSSDDFCDFHRQLRVLVHLYGEDTRVFHGKRRTDGGDRETATRASADGTHWIAAIDPDAWTGVIGAIVLVIIDSETIIARGGTSEHTLPPNPGDLHGQIGWHIDLNVAPLFHWNRHVEEDLPSGQSTDFQFGWRESELAFVDFGGLIRGRVKSNALGCLD